MKTNFSLLAAGVLTLSSLSGLADAGSKQGAVTKTAKGGGAGLVNHGATVAKKSPVESVQKIKRPSHLPQH
jgi:hypothetical protein